VDVFPIFPVEQPGEDKENHQEQQNIGANALTICLKRLGGIGQEIDQVIYRAILLFSGHRAGGGHAHVDALVSLGCR